MYSVYLTESPKKRQKRAHDAEGGTAGNDTSGSNTLKADASASSKAGTGGPVTPTAHIEQLITEHLGFNPRVYIDQLTQLANDYLHQLNAPIEDEVRAKLAQQGTRPNAELEAEQGVHMLVTLIENALDHTFDTYELYCLRSIFRVSPAQARVITLAHHRGLDLRSVEEKRTHLDRLSKKASKGKNASAAAAASEQPKILSAQEQSRELAERAVALRKSIAANRNLNAVLRAATAKTAQSLADVHELESKRPALFASADLEAGEDSVMRDTGAKHADKVNVSATSLSVAHPALGLKLRDDAVKLLDVLASLRESDPLGTALVSSGVDRSGNGGAAAGESDPSVGNALPWTSRDGYLQFVADKARK
ncbi:hypothetical protein V8E36_007839 [Tilletia maclaganii]